MRRIALILLLAVATKAHPRELATNDLDASVTPSTAMLSRGSRESGLRRLGSERPLRLQRSSLDVLSDSDASDDSLADWDERSAIKVAKKPKPSQDVQSASPSKMFLKRFSSFRANANSRQMEVAKAVFNLVQNMLGSGVLSIPAGIAAIGGERGLLIPSAVVVVALGALSSYTFYSVGQQCGNHGVSKYHEAWVKCVGQKSKAVVMTLAVAYSTLACLGYAIIIGDFFSALARGGIFGRYVESSKFFGDRRTWTLSFTIMLYPLSALRDLSALAFTSLLGNLAMVYTAGFMVARYLDGSYRPGGRFYDHLPLAPSFAKGNAWKTYFSGVASFVLMSQCATAFSPHNNAPAYYQASGRDNGKFKLIVFLGYFFAILIQLAMMISGFLTFGSSSNGVILNSYAENDKLAAVARVLDGLSLVFAYPLMFQGLKAPMREVINFILKRKRFSHIRKFLEKMRVTRNVMITTFFVAVITIISFLTDFAAFINAIRGAFCASTLVYILPPLMYLLGPHPAVKGVVAKSGNIGLLAFGGLLTVLGLYRTILML